MTLDRRHLLLAAFAALLPASAAAEDKKALPAKKLFPFYDLYLEIPPAERSRFTLAYYLKINGAPAAGHTLWLVAPDGRRTAIPAAADGRLTRMPTLADLKGGSTIDAAKSNPGDKFQLNMELQPVVRLADTIAADDLAASIDQCNAALKKKGGLIGFAVPKMEQALFVGAGSGSAVAAGGAAKALPVLKGMPAFRPADHLGAVSVKLARTPARVLLAGAKVK